MKYRKLSDLQKEVETLEGKWELSPGHELVYTEHRRQTAVTENTQTEKQASFKASLVAAEPEALVILVTTKEDENRTVTGFVKLSGKWALDVKNRITFSVKRGLGRDDKLTFQGAWEINDNFQITYAFSTEEVFQGAGKKKRRVTRVAQELVFDGHWDISEKNRLTYLIGGDSESAFRFRGTFETASILAKQGEIRYQAGIEYKTSRGTKKRRARTITLFGKWKLSDDLALSFELECADGRRPEIRFGTEFNLKKWRGRLPLLPDEVAVNLVSSGRKPLGIELVLSKDLFDGNARTFIRFRESLREKAVEAGITIPW